MTVTLAYDAELSRVRIDADTLNGAGTATYATVDRTVDDITFRTVRGGLAWPVTAGVFELTLDDYEFPANVPVTYRVRSFDAADVLLTTQTATITATITRVWLKSVARPFLNRAITIAGLEETERPGDVGVFQVVDSSFPVAVLGTRGSRRFTLTAQTATRGEAEDLDFVLAAGDLMFLHVPPDFEPLHVPSMHVAVEDSTQVRLNPHASPTTRFALPMVEVAPPAVTVYGTTANWQTVINAYATWSDLIADKASWSDVVEIIGSPGDVIVG